MKYYSLFLSFLILCAITSNAQRKNSTASLTLPNHSTLSGTLKFGDWDINPDKIQFKQNDSNRFVAYTPEQVLLFTTNLTTFESAKVSIDRASREVADLQKYIVYDTMTQNVFLKQVVSGPVSLFQYTPQNGAVNFFIKTKEGQWHRLNYKRFLNDDFEIQEANTFRNELTYFLNDCPKILPSLQTLNYTTASLRTLFLSYARCKGQVIHEKEEAKPKKSLGIYAGLSYGSMNTKGMETLLLNGAKFNPSANPAFLISAGFPIAHRFQQHQVQIELGTKQLRISATDGKAYNFYMGHDFSIRINYMFAKLNLLYRYHIIKTDKFKLFADIGASFMMAMKAELELKDLSTGKTYPNATPFRRTEESIIGGVGAHIGRISILGRYEMGTGLSQTSSVKSHSGTGFLFAGYHLFQ